MADNEPTASEQKATRPGRPRDQSIPGKIGRGLGRLVRRAKQTEIWTKTAQAYQEGLDGKR